MLERLASDDDDRVEEKEAEEEQDEEDKHIGGGVRCGEAEAESSALVALHAMCAASVLCVVPQFEGGEVRLATFAVCGRSASAMETASLVWSLRVATESVGLDGHLFAVPGAAVVRAVHAEDEGGSGGREGKEVGDGRDVAAGGDG
jgi:hypothetical protein